MTRSSSIRGAALSVFRRPSLILAEIAWRWAFGSAVLALIFLALLTWLDSQVITAADELLLASGLPFFTVRALAHVFGGSVAKLLRAAAVVVPAVVVLWAIAAAAGRTAIVSALLPNQRPHWRSVLGLCFLRAVSVLAAFAAFAGAIVFSSRIGQPPPPAAPRPGLALISLFAVAAAVALAWSVLNWYLAVAPLFATGTGVSDSNQRDTIGALAATAHHFRHNASKVFGIATIFGLIHVGLWLLFISIAPVPMLFAPYLPGWVTLLVLLVLTLSYLAAKDALHVSRLAAHAALITHDDPLRT